MATTVQTISGSTVTEPRFFTTQRGEPAAVFDLAVDRYEDEVRYNLSAVEDREAAEPRRVSIYYAVFAFGARKVRLLRGLGTERRVRVTGTLETRTRTVRGREIREGRMTLATLTRSGLDRS